LIRAPSPTATPGPKKTPGSTTIDQGDAAGQRPVAQAALHDRLGHGQLGARVDAEDLVLAALGDQAGEAPGGGQAVDLGQVVLALGVVVADRLEQAEQGRPLAQHDAAVAEVDGQGLGVGLGRLDDPEQAAAGALDHHAAVVRRVGAAKAERDQGRPLGAAPERHHVLQGARRDQRRVTEQHQHVAGAVGTMVTVEGVPGGQHRVAGAERQVLHHGAVGLGGLGDLVHARAEHHHDPLWTERRGRVDHVAQHGLAGDLVQHLGQVRGHAHALAGGQSEAMRTPLPAARITTASFSSVMGRRLRGSVGLRTWAGGHRPQLRQDLAQQG
jgi:hypothetical protein